MCAGAARLFTTLQISFIDYHRVHGKKKSPEVSYQHVQYSVQKASIEASILILQPDSE